MVPSRAAVRLPFFVGSIRLPSVKHSKEERAGAGWWVFAVAMFLSAFLVFQIQPLISKHILPWFGGTSSVWTTCVLVFQALLFAGYAYAHLLGRLPIRVQAATHVLLLLGASMMAVIPAEAWKPRGDEDPLVRIVVMLLATIGLPYFALSATGPLLQLWFWRAYPRAAPYRLYALSNAGSLLALISYPFLVEPSLSTPQQAGLWRAGFVCFLLICAIGGWIAQRRAVGRGGTPVVRLEAEPPTQPTVFSKRVERLFWVGWSACSVILFMAVTNQLTINVASVPFLWILPLSIYLLTFILAFSGRRVYPRPLAGLMLAIAVASLAFILQFELDYSGAGDFRLSISWQIGVVGLALFLMCLVCHGELYRLRPEPRRLTSFYLWIAFGGMVGGLVVGVFAPLVFLLYQELHLGMLLCCLLFLAVALKDPASPLSQRRFRWAAAPLLVGIIGLAGVLAGQSADMLTGMLDTRRNFFGLLRVHEVGTVGAPDHALELYDGSVLHGYQFARAELRQVPTVYYSTRTGVGGVLEDFKPEKTRRVGVVGLGVGTLATYGRPSDYMRFYEINPDVVDLATNTFSYLAQSRSRWEISLGDARLKLEQEAVQHFDVLVLDAFSSDSIPVHLLTEEAFDLYERHLDTNGVLAVHISNDHLDLSPIVYHQAEARGYYALEVRNRGREDEPTRAAIWMILSRDLDFLKQLTGRFEPLQAAGDVKLVNQPPAGHDRVRTWTDSYSNLFQILR